MDNRPVRNFTRLAVAIVVAALVISAAALSYSSLQPTITKTVTTINTTYTNVISTVTSTYITIQTVTTTPESSPGTSSTTTSDTTTITTGPPTWSYQGLVSAVANSSEVKPYITNAYYYFVMRDGAASPGNGTQLFADVYVVRAQTVTGNWTTGYTMAYTGRQIFNGTVQYTKPSTYNVTRVAVTNLADQSYPISFDATQKKAIGVALANSTVKADIGGMAYFVTFADPQVNGTLGYWVQISQVNGYRSLAVLVNPDLTEVSEVIASTIYPNIGGP